ncbi:MAG: sigma-70 family RNA polymerase sigma factor, partial [Candidatus Rokubacteria bacterium]|nr:sigma-70 family RNA polymerase sigma factor [Candidatus Rokubacteria bacterium]
AALVERYGPRLLAVARRLLHSETDAEDAVQRAFLQCYLRATGYRPEWAVSTWLYRILTNTCVDELRRRAVRRDHRAALDGWPPPANGGPSARDLDVRRALARVPREARILLTLRYADGLTYAELARIRGISINTVKSQLARGKAILRAALAPGDDA